MTRRLPTTILLGVAALVVLSGESRAAEAPSGQFLRQEVAGLEVYGLGLAQGHGVSSRSEVGIGGMLRLGRHRWSRGYVTPVQAGLFVATPELISARVLTEGGVVLRSGIGVLELGLGAGVGILTIGNGNNDCDGTCEVGGNGLILSPVVRLLFREATHVPVGVVLRGEVPASKPDGSGFGYFVGYGTQVMLGLDVGAGW